MVKIDIWGKTKSDMGACKSIFPYLFLSQLQSRILWQMQDQIHEDLKANMNEFKIIERLMH